MMLLSPVLSRFNTWRTKITFESFSLESVIFEIHLHFQESLLLMWNICRKLEICFRTPFCDYIAKMKILFLPKINSIFL